MRRKWQEMPNIDFKLLILMLRTKGVDGEKLSIESGYSKSSIYAYTSGRPRQPHFQMARIIWNLAVQYLTDEQITAAVIPDE